jgi:hypothetical protein
MGGLRDRVALAGLLSGWWQRVAVRPVSYLGMALLRRPYSRLVAPSNSMKQLTLDSFRYPHKGEQQQLEAPTDQQFRSIPARVESENRDAPLVIPAPLALRPFISTPEQQAPRISSPAELICVLSQHVPLNDYKLPTTLYRPDLLDCRMFNDIRDSEYQKVLSFLEAAEVTVTYHEGYPAIQSQPLWRQLPWEATEDYQLFDQYLQLPGARQLHLLPTVNGGRAAALFHTNYWMFRVHASDTFAVAHYQRMREQRILRTDDKAFLESERILTTLYKLAPEINWEVLKEEPDKFVKVLSMVSELQRKALGTSQLRQDEPSRAAQPVEVIMRQMVKEDRDPNAPPPAITEEGEVDIRDILRQADVKSLQELVLRVGSR